MTLLWFLQKIQLRRKNVKCCSSMALIDKLCTKTLILNLLDAIVTYFLFIASNFALVLQQCSLVMVGIGKNR